MKLVIFGLSVSSSWGNGHATLWRGLLRALRHEGHSAIFFEKDVPWYANSRDVNNPDYFDLRLYRNWAEVAVEAAEAIREADAAIVTSYCPDAIPATDLVLQSGVPSKVFYDLDAPITLAKHRAGEHVAWLPKQGYAGFDLVLSYSGGRSLDALENELRAHRAVALYGSADPAIHHPVESDEMACSLSYLGTYAEDRERRWRVVIEPARRCSDKIFVLGGSQYPQDFPWTNNIYFRNHVEPAAHNAFYCSSGMTLNITRQAMLEFGHCPSGRIFEAAACGVPVLTDHWDGIADFFEPGPRDPPCDRRRRSHRSNLREPR